MSIDYMKKVWALPLKSREKLIALAIADNANSDGVAWPSYNHIVGKTGMARATVSAGIKCLVKFEWCKISNHSEFGKGKKVNLYTILDTPKVQYVNNRSNFAKSSAPEPHPKSSAVELPKVQSSPPKSSAPEHEPSLEPSIFNHHIPITLKSDCLDFSKLFYDFLSANGGKKNPTADEINKGADTIEKLVRIDNWDLQTEVIPALRWGVKDHFWGKQVRSLAPLRKKSKNGEAKFANLFNAFSAKDIYFQSQKQKNQAEILQLGRIADERLRKNTETEARSITQATNKIVLSLPE